MRRALRATALAVAAVIAAGCQTTMTEGEAGQDGARGDGVQGYDHRLPPHAQEAERDERAVARRPESGAAPPEVDGDPQRFVGLAKTRVDGLLGPPDQLRREPPAEVWQYRTETCILDLFLYEEAGDLRVIHVEARDRNTDLVDAESCLEDILRRHVAAREVS